MTALVTVAVPSYNQGRFLDRALTSIFDQALPLEVFVADAGSTDESLSVIEKWAPRLAGWRSHADRGQAAAVNECIARGSAPYVCWLNSDDWLLPGGLAALIARLESAPPSRITTRSPFRSCPPAPLLAPRARRRLASPCRTTACRGSGRPYLRC